jgi:Flp pilus assembly protein TadG
MGHSIAEHSQLRRRRRPNGQSVAEFALVLPILAIILMAILQLAFIFGTQIGLTNAAREAARFASVVRTDKVAAAPNATDLRGPAVRAELVSTILPQNVQSYLPANLNAGQTRVCYQSFTDASGATAIRVKVDVTYGHPLFIPLIAGLLTNGSGLLTVTASEQLPVDNPPIVSTDISSADPGNCY